MSIDFPATAVRYVSSRPPRLAQQWRPSYLTAFQHEPLMSPKHEHVPHFFATLNKQVSPRYAPGQVSPREGTFCGKGERAARRPGSPTYVVFTSGNTNKHDRKERGRVRGRMAERAASLGPIGVHCRTSTRPSLLTRINLPFQSTWDCSNN
ncbi:hypothetical protein Bbelb_181620 [Branchiostoma belcheri]|nr:hypothetical protein Bbelb_181620 [Branchiostoma belcheri]